MQRYCSEKSKDPASMGTENEYPLVGCTLRQEEKRCFVYDKSECHIIASNSYLENIGKLFNFTLTVFTSYLNMLM